MLGTRNISKIDAPDFFLFGFLQNVCTFMHGCNSINAHVFLLSLLKIFTKNNKIPLEKPKKIWRFTIPLKSTYLAACRRIVVNVLFSLVYVWLDKLFFTNFKIFRGFCGHGLWGLRALNQLILIGRP